jgi:hypothetical protein
VAVELIHPAGVFKVDPSLGVVLQQPGTYIGVSSLWASSFLIEIDATALVD